MGCAGNGPAFLFRAERFYRPLADHIDRTGDYHLGNSHPGCGLESILPGETGPLKSWLVISWWSNPERLKTSRSGFLLRTPFPVPVGVITGHLITVVFKNPPRRHHRGSRDAQASGTDHLFVRLLRRRKAGHRRQR